MAGRKIAQLCQALAHVWFVGRQARTFGDDVAVNLRQSPALQAWIFTRLLRALLNRRREALIGVWKPFTNITQSQGTKNRVD